MNEVTLHGRLASDVEYRTTADGFQVAKLKVVTNERYTNKKGEKVDQAEFHPVVFMGPKAENVNKWFKKGDGILLKGKLTHRSYEDKEGNKRFFTEVVGLSWTFPFGRATENQSTEAVRTEAKEEATADDGLPF